MTEPITSFKGDHRFLSNFWYSRIDFEGYIFATNEHFYQAMKATTKADLEMIIKAPVPSEAKKLGRQIQVRSDWEQIKLTVMETGLREKFKNAQMAHLLVSTGDAEIIEGNHWGDTYWGVCNGVGENHLGKLLMQIRSELA